MIITLKKADFSGNKIGTLSTWSIFTTLGSGATYSGVSLVTKGASYSGTVTLANGYEVGSAGVKVTMGGTDVTSSAVKISGSTITISISAVTGTVYISVPTKNTATGEEEDDSSTIATLTINPTPSDAKVDIYASGYTQSGNSMKVLNDGTVSPRYQVYKDNYLSKGGIISNITKSQTLNITLSPYSNGSWTELDMNNEAQKVSNYFLNSTGKHVGPYDKWCYYIICVTAGQKYRAKSVAGQSALLWMTFAESPDGSTSMTPVSCSDNTGMAYGIADEFTIPSGANYLIINSRQNSGDIVPPIVELKS